MENLLPMLIIFSYSLVLNSMAPLLRSFRELFEISTALSSLLPFFSLTGTVLSNIVVGVYINKLGIKRALFIGSILTITGTLTVALAKNYTIALIGIFVFGFSTGFGFTGGTTLLTTSNNASFGFFHGAYGLGGMLAPFVITLAEKLTGNFKNVYFFYSTLFALFLIYISKQVLPKISTESLNLKEIKVAFSDKNFALFLILLILYSSVEIGTITWAGNTMKQSSLSSFTAYTLFWLLFTLSRFMLGIISKITKNIVRINSLALIILVLSFALTKEPIIFVISGFFLGPIFPFTQSRGIDKIDKKYVSIFNGSTYAFTSLGGNVVSTIMGITLERNLIFAWLVPVLLTFIMFSVGKKVK
ncbi:MAG: MFS transporter [Fervidobacterium sp.]